MNLIKYLLAKCFEIVLYARHYLYDNKILEVYRPTVKTICIGNLEFGGTGKTPHAEYIIKKLIKLGERPAFLSRGYGRKTKGFRWVFANNDWKICGDEPLQVKTNIPEILVAVCENRKQGIQTIMMQHPETTVIVLDDAFQHLPIKAGLNILLTLADKPFNENKLFPEGTLRDLPQAASKADVIIFTKAKNGNPRQKMNPPSFTTKIGYDKPVSVGLPLELNNQTNLIGFAGIAKPDPFDSFLKSIGNCPLPLFSFADHHEYSLYDIRKLKTLLSNIAAQNKALITTQKDWMRIKGTVIEQELKNTALFYIPITIIFIEKEADFESILYKYLSQ